MWTGTFFALAAGLMWGLVFIAPLLLPEYPAALQSFGRYLAFGLIALPLAWLDRARLAQAAGQKRHRGLDPNIRARRPEALKASRDRSQLPATGERGWTCRRR